MVAAEEAAKENECDFTRTLCSSKLSGGKEGDGNAGRLLNGEICVGDSIGALTRATDPKRFYAVA